MVIWAIFGFPGALWGPGGPMWGLGGPAETKFTNLHVGLFLALRCHFLDLTNFSHYDFGVLGQNCGLEAKKKAILGQNRVYAKVRFVRYPRGAQNGPIFEMMT